MNIDQIPMLPGRGLLGHMTLFRKEPIGFLRSLARGGDLFRLDFVVGSAVVVTAPRLIQETLVDHARSVEKPAMLRYMLQPALGDGVSSARGEKWRRQRRVLAPFLQPAEIVQHADCIVSCAQRVVASWSDGATVDMLRETSRISMSMTAQALFGTDASHEMDEVYDAVGVMQQWAMVQMATMTPVLLGELSRSLERLGGRLPGRPGALLQALGDRLHVPLLLGREHQSMRDAIAVVDRCVQRIIDERRAAGPGPGRPDLLSKLLSARHQDDGGLMSDRQVRDEVVTMLLGGFETTHAALTWSLYLLQQNPEAYRRVRAEVDALGRAPRHEDLSALGYTLRVFKEALRLYPPAAIFSREAYADISIGGNLLPAGTIVFISPYATQHRADLWPDPERFDPERFSAAEEGKRPRYSYLPFGAGPRVCIGSHLALMEGPLVLATMLRQVDIEKAFTGEIEPEFKATLQPRGPVPMRIRRRQAAS